MNVRELKDSAGAVFSPKVSTESVYLKGSETNLDSKLSSMDNTISGKMNNVTLATVATSGSYNDLNNKPTIPTRTSQLTNDSGFITGSSGGDYLPLSGGTITGALSVSSATFEQTNGKDPNLVAGTSRLYRNALVISNPTTQNDLGWIRVLGSSEENTILEIATGDDGNQIGASTVEEIYVRRYTTSSTVGSEIRLLDKSNNTSFPGGVYAPGFYVSSSRTVKENIVPTSVSGEDLINSVKVVDFNYIADEKHYPKVGFIAEDTDPLLSTPEQKTMDQPNCIGVMMKAIQELSAKVKTLTNKLESLTPPLLKHLIHKRLPSKCINSKLILKEVA